MAGAQQKTVVLRSREPLTREVGIGLTGIAEGATANPRITLSTLKPCQPAHSPTTHCFPYLAETPKDHGITLCSSHGSLARKGRVAGR